jgi:hypothetical protein
MRLAWLLFGVAFASAQSTSGREAIDDARSAATQASSSHTRFASEDAQNYSLPSITLTKTIGREVSEDNCVTAYSFLKSPRIVKDSISPCTLIDEFFFFGTGQKMNQGAVEHGDQEIRDYYPIYRKYLNLKSKEGHGSFDAGSPGLILLGMASTPTIADLKKRQIYEAYSFHQLSILHSDSIDQSGFSKDSVSELIDGFFIEKLSSIGITTLGTLVCAVEFDIFGIPLPDILKTDAVQSCIHN